MAKFNVPTFCGGGFADWSMKMKKLLILMGVWYVIEGGLKKLRATVMLPEEEMAVLKNDKVSDAMAISEIHKHLCPSICVRYYNATSAKETWDFLHEDFQMHDPSPVVEEIPSVRSMRNTSRVEESQTERAKSHHRHASEGGPSTEPIRSARQIEIQRGKRKMNDGPPVASKRPILEAEKTQATTKADPSRTSENRAFPKSILMTGKTKMNEPRRTLNEGPSGDNPHFYMVLSRTAVKLAYSLQFPVPVASRLPSNNIIAIVKCTSGDTYKVRFFGQRKQKVFGLGWKQLVIDQNLVEGDKVRFDVIKCSSNELKLKLHIPKRVSPPEPGEGIRRNGDDQDHATTILLDDDNDYEDSDDGGEEEEEEDDDYDYDE